MSPPKAAPPPARPGSPALPVVLGLGNEARRDDGAGVAVVRELGRRGPLRARLVAPVADASALLELWPGTPLAVLVDATRSGAPPGTVTRFEGPGGPFAAPVPRTSSHGITVREALELAETLGRRPTRWVVYGIEAASVAPGIGLTPEVERAVVEVAGRVSGELSRAEASTEVPG